MTQIEFYYDVGSPNAYLTHKVLPGIAQRTGASVTYRAMLLGGVFVSTGNQSPMFAFEKVQPKLAYMALEIERFVKRHGVEYRQNPHHPLKTVAAMRALVALDSAPGAVDALFNAGWRDERNIQDPEVVAQVLTEAGFDGAAVIAQAGSDEVKQRLRTVTEAAVDRGIFGTPTLFVGDEMFFGKDSLRDLEDHLTHD